MDWEDVTNHPAVCGQHPSKGGEFVDYIMGNPPFVGFAFMTAEQKSDMGLIFPQIKNLDFVTAWYMKAADYMKFPSGGVVRRNTSAYNSLPFNPKLKERAKKLRKAGNLSEVLLWKRLKGGQINGWDFDRQKIIGNYIVDFYCANIGLVVEVDGKSHDNKAEYDKERDEFMKSLELDILRVSDVDVLKNIESVVMAIKDYSTKNHPGALRHPSKGGEFTNHPDALRHPSGGGVPSADGGVVRTTFVSTNSIAQGEQPAILWKPLIEQGIHINFGVPTFKWNSEASEKAAVHCVIVGFSYVKTEPTINQYLMKGPIVFIESRKKPICGVPEIGIGNKPIDGGNYLFTEEEMKGFIAKEPKSELYFRKWVGAHEFINGYYRYCLWLGDCQPSELKQMPEAVKRAEAVRNFRLESKSVPTQKLANTPTRFHVENMPEQNYIILPRVSSENRRYIPIGFISSHILASDSAHIIPNATLYHFGILTSNVHNAWMRAICGRLKSDYRYSKDIVYNNFPWPGCDHPGTPCHPSKGGEFTETTTPFPSGGGVPSADGGVVTSKQKAEIEKLAQGVLDARAKYPDSTLADMYGETSMLFLRSYSKHTASLIRPL